MDYSLIINNNQILSGNIFTVLLIIVITIAIAIGLVITIRKKLKENEVMKYEFITIIAHKFRTPLTHLKWLVEEMVVSETETSKKESLTDLQQSTDKLIGLTGTLIELTNLDSENRATYNIEPISVCELTRNVTSQYKNAFHAKNIFFSITCPQEEIYSKIDSTRMEFVLQTLLENSYTYTPPGRKVDVTVTESGNRALISVADNGIGISAEDLNRIFGKFYRARNARAVDTEGFGVGLYLAQSIVKRLGGWLEVYSEGLDKGSIFTIVLPKTRKTK